MTSLRFATAVHVLVLLAHEKADAPARAACSRHMGASMGANAVVVRRIIGALAEAGLIRTRAGAQGGAWLAKPAAKIRMSEVYDAVEDAPLLGFREKGSKACPVGCAAPKVIGGLLSRMDQASRDALAKITLAEIVRQVERAAA